MIVRKLMLFCLFAKAASTMSYAADIDLDACDFSLNIPLHILEARVVVFGELHGTKEAPFVFLSAICERIQSNDGKTIIVGLEYPQVESENLLKYVNSSGATSDKRHLLETFFWKREMQDGRTSVAMFELIESLRRIRQETGRLDVFATVPEAGSGRHEELMAAAIDRSVQQNPESPHLILVGNLHSRRKVGRSNDPEFRPMLHWVEAENVSVNIVSQHGDYWACTMDGCGRRSLSGQGVEFGSLRTAMPRIDSSFHHDHAIIFDRFSASPPATTVERESRP